MAGCSIFVPSLMFRPLTFFILFLFLFLSSPGQNSVLDSLTVSLQKIGEDTTRVKTYNRISSELEAQSNFSGAKLYALKAISLSEKLAFPPGSVMGNKILGNSFFDQGDYPRALEYFFSSLKIQEKLNNPSGTAAILTNIGNTFNNELDYAKALEYYERARQLFDSVKTSQGKAYANVLLGEGVALEGKKEYDRALEKYSFAQQICETQNDSGGLATLLNNIGNTYKDNKHDYPKALEYYNRALKIDEKIADKYNAATVLNNIGSVYHLRKNDKVALSYSLRSLALTKEINALDLSKDAESQLSDIYDAMGDKSNALLHFRAFIDARDSIFSSEKIKDIANQEARRREEKMDIDFKESQIRQDADLKRQKTVTYAFTVGFALVLILIVVVFRSLRQSRSQNKIIEIQKKEVEHKNALVEHKQKEIVDSITYAKRLQQAILPSVQSIQECLPKSFVLYLPKDIVAGDFYWMHATNDILLIAAADCTGHGVPGALVSIVCSNALNRTVKEFGLTNTGQILDKVTALVMETFEKSGEEIKDGMDISLLSIDKKRGKVQWSGANNPLWIVNTGELIEIKADKQPIGQSEDRKSFTTHQLAYTPGQSFYLITDGYADQFSNSDKKLMKKQFKKLILELQDKNMHEQLTALDNFHTQWKGDMEQTDDVTVIGIRI